MSTEALDARFDRYARMLLVRRVEEWVIAQYAAQNAVFARGENPSLSIRCPTHLSIGQEAAAVGVASALRAGDTAFSTHRCHAHYLAMGGDLPRMVAELLGREGGCARGKGGSMHLIDTSVGMMGASAIVGGSIPLAVGAAMSSAMRGAASVAVAFFGDGAVEQGVFHECLNLAALRRLPVIFACENNLYATLSHVSARQAAPISRAGGVVRDARRRGRRHRRRGRAGGRRRRGRARAAGGGAHAHRGHRVPLDVARGHGVRHGAHAPHARRARRVARALPLVIARAALRAAGVTDARFDDEEQRVRRRIDEAVALAAQSPEPSPAALYEHLAGEEAAAWRG